MENEEKANKPKSAKINFIYSLIHQILLLILPVITTPYVSRILNSDGLGQFSFSDSIAFYFSLLAAIGFSTYAQREISRNREDIHQQSIVFWEIMIVKFFTALVSIGLMIALIQLPFFSLYKTLLYILTISVASVLLDTTFIFQGNENFKTIAFVNAGAKTLCVIFVFIFVKTQSDLWIYVLLHALNPFLTALFLLPFLRKYLVRVKANELHPRKHLWPSLKLFIPTIAISIYNMVDRTMIGVFITGDVTVIKDGVETVVKASDYENGLYIQAEKIVRTFVAVMLALGTVMLPRNSALFAQGNIEKVKANIAKAVQFCFFAGAPMAAGLAAVAYNFSPWFFGPGYEKVPLLVCAFSPLILFVGLNAVYGTHYMLPTGMDKRYTISVSIGAAFNIALNAVLIYFLGSLGAVIASISSELLILIVELIFLRKEFNFGKNLLVSWKHILCSLIMFGIVFPLNYVWEPSILHTILMVLIGVAAYFLGLLLLRDKTLFEAVGFVKNKIQQFRSHGKGNHEN